MQPRLELLSQETIQRVLAEAFLLLSDPGIKVQSAQARELLAEGGAQVDDSHEVVKIPADLVYQALESAPRNFHLYNRGGEPIITYGGESVHFDPGSSAVHVLDPETLQHLPSQTADLIRIVKVAEMLPEYDAQSTAVVCNEVPKQIGDLYRLYIVLLYSAKPIITGAFTMNTAPTMFDMLALFAGERKALVAKPQAVFDVCPSPPLIWSEFGAQNLIELARAGVPAEIVAMPLAGAASPVTLLGSVVQHTAECLSGITIHQLARAGSPVVWGGAPAIFDMRKGTTPMGAVESGMMDVCNAQVGKSLGLPTHAYLGASDAKIVDAQAGLESGISAMIGALAGINMISGAGMLDFLACQSVEKLVIDAEAIAMTRRLAAGVEAHTGTLALEFFAGINFKGDFLKQKATRELFPKEQYLPSPVIDRDTLRGWQQAGSLDTFSRAKERVRQLLERYEPPRIPPEMIRELNHLVEHKAREFDIGKVPLVHAV